MSFKQKVARQVYSWLLFMASPFYVIKLWVRGQKEAEYGQRIGERFGFYGKTIPNVPYRGEYIWVHAVSLGEARASGVLIEHLRKQMPGMKLLLTHGTATGWAQGKALLQEGDVQCWMPVDMAGAVKRFFRHFQPRVGLLIETEMWPNALYAANDHHVPMFLVNARLSERSLNRALRVSALLCPAYQGLRAALAQSDEDAERLRKMGVPVVEVFGNMKYDMLPDLGLLAQGARWISGCTRKVVMAASTREGEEELLLQAWQQMFWAETEKPILLIVPRHPQRFEDVAELVTGTGLSMSRRSSWNHDKIDEQAQKADVWLGDSLREMVIYYALADIVLLGGSFKKYGGQNLIEALACGCPVILGEYTYNFALPSQLALDAGVACRVSSFNEALGQAKSWLQTPEKLEELQQKSIVFIQKHQGSAEKMAHYVAHKYDKPNSEK
ncbi:MAG: 3-deoxy-D-manno-octulosonic acid transferase [Saezia sp.]